MPGYQWTTRAWRPRSASSKRAGYGKVFREVARGARSDRHQLRQVLAHLTASGMLMVTRLARSTRDLL